MIIRSCLLSLSRTFSRLPVVLAVALGALAVPGLGAQSPGRGTISGLITEASSGAVLAGVRVAIVGSDRTAVSARDGTFVLTGLPGGDYNLNVSFLGYAERRELVTLAENGSARVNVTLGAEVVKMAGFTVEGIRGGQARALNQQATAPNVVNIISADAIGQFPDTNIAEALQRLPGISITRKNETGEGRFVIIRGLESNFNSVSVDGVRLPTTEGGQRAVPLDIFTANAAERVIVTKTVTPDMDADAIGGAIELQTPTAFDDTQRILRGTFEYGYSDLVGRNNTGATLTYGDTFGADRKWGFLVAATYLDRSTGGEQVGDGDTTVGLIGGPGGIRSGEARRGVPGFMGLEFNRYRIDRERRAVSASLDWRPRDELQLFVRGNYADLAEDREREEFEVYADNRRENLQDLLARQRLFVDRFEEIYSTISAGGSLRPAPDLKFDFIAAYARAESDRPDYFELRHGLPNLLNRDGTPNTRTSTIFFRDIPTLGPVTFDLSRPQFPTWTQRTSQNLYDDTRYTFNRFDSWQDRGQEDIWTLKLDGRQERDFGTWPGYVKVGGKFSRREKEQVSLAKNVSIRRTATTAANFFPRSTVVTGEPVRHVDDNYLWGRLYDVAAARAFVTNNPTVFTAGTGLGGREFFREEILAGYAQAGVDFGRLDLLAGVRLEQTDLTATSGRTPAARTAGNDYLDVLPGLHANYRISDRLIVRAASTFTMARPNFDDLSGRRTETSGAIASGNPDLEPISSTNFDLSVERYLGSLGVVSAGVFHKRIENFIYRGLATATLIDTASGLPITRPENGDTAKVSGLELSYQQQFRMLPSPFDGLGFLANVTFLDGESRLKPNSAAARLRVNQNETFPLYDQPDRLGNVAVSYEKYGFSVRLAYVYRGGYLERIDGESATYDKYLLPNQQYDLTASYRLSGNLRLYLEATNISTSYTYDSTMGPDRGIQKNLIQNGWIGTVGLSWSL